MLMPKDLLVYERHTEYCAANQVIEANWRLAAPWFRRLLVLVSEADLASASLR